MSSTLETEVGILARVRSEFGEPLGFHVVKLLLIHQIPKHSDDFNRGMASFNQEDRVESISFKIEVVGYKFLVD